MARLERPIHLYDRASGKYLGIAPSAASVRRLTGAGQVGLSKRLETSPFHQSGYFGCSYRRSMDASPSEMFKEDERFFLVLPQKGPMAGKLVLFSTWADIAAYFEMPMGTMWWRKSNGKDFPGPSRWSIVERPDPRLAEVPRWDPVNGLWDLECDLADLRDRWDVAKQRKKVYLYDRASGKHLKTFAGTDAAADFAGTTVPCIFGRMKDSFGHHRGFFSYSRTEPDVTEDFTPYCALHLIERQDGEGPLLFPTLGDLASWLGCSPSLVSERVIRGSLLPGGHSCRRVTKADPAFADVPRWDRKQGYWTLQDVI